MKKRGFLLMLWILVSLVLMSVKVIPEFKEQWSLVIAIFWLVSYVLVIIYSIRVWIRTYSIQKENKRINDILKVIFKSIFFLVVIPLFILIIYFAHAISDWEVYTEKKTLDSHTFYIYENDCFPSSSRGCRDYYMNVYEKNKYLPILHHLIKLDYYADSLYIEKDKLILKAAYGYKEKDVGRISKVEL